MFRADKDPSFELLSGEPLNGQPAPSRLVAAARTPRRHFYVRNHAPVPELAAGELELTVDGLVGRPLTLHLEELERDFPGREVTATLQCAGNRRDELARLRPIPGETLWGAGAIGNAVWEGVPLAAVLEAADPAPEAAHVAFTGADRVEKAGERFPFGGSIPLSKAQDPGVLLALRMNGAPLSPEHGFPLRVVVPGYIGARSVKWLERITLRREPSENHYQRRAYKLFPPDVDAGEADWERGLELGELSVTSAICEPAPGAEVPAGRVRVAGYALAGGERTVERVEVTADGGRSWHPAEADPAPPGVWRLWAVELELGPGTHELACRAWDSAANTQPEEAGALWNFKGYMNNSWHRLTVRCQ